MDHFSLVEKKVSEILMKVELYQDLFGSKDTTKTLNSTFPECFALMQKSLYFEIVCRISALFDPEKTNGNKNLTLAHLAKESGIAFTPEMKLELKEIKLEFEEQGLKKIRNKLYAHNDLDANVGTVKIISSVSYETLKSLLLRVFKLVRNLGLSSKKIPHGQIIHRTTLLPKNRDGSALVEKLRNV